MIAFIKLVYYDRGLNKFFRVVEVVYKKDRETFDSYYKKRLEKENDPIDRVIAKIEEGTCKLYKLIKEMFCEEFEQYKDKPNVFHLDWALTSAIKWLCGIDDKVNILLQ